MNKKRNTIVWEGWCSAEIPEDWIWTQDDDLINIFDESAGVGVLQISLAKRQRSEKPSNEEAVKLSHLFAESQSWEVDARLIRVNRFKDSFMSTMVYCVVGEESTNWRVWHIVEDTRVACITYNSAESDKDIEGDAVDAIVNSFKWE